jgi:hypothetical protein
LEIDHWVRFMGSFDLHMTCTRIGAMNFH